MGEIGVLLPGAKGLGAYVQSSFLWKDRSSFQSFSSRNVQELQACLLAVLPRSSPADLFRSFTDTRRYKDQMDFSGLS